MLGVVAAASPAQPPSMPGCRPAAATALCPIGQLTGHRRATTMVIAHAVLMGGESVQTPCSGAPSDEQIADAGAKAAQRIQVREWFADPGSAAQTDMRAIVELIAYIMTTMSPDNRHPDGVLSRASKLMPGDTYTLMWLAGNEMRQWSGNRTEVIDAICDQGQYIVAFVVETFMERRATGRHMGALLYRLAESMDVHEVAGLASLAAQALSRYGFTADEVLGFADGPTDADRVEQEIAAWTTPVARAGDESADSPEGETE